MKQLLLTLLWITASLGTTFAQSFQFLNNDEPVADGSVIKVGGLPSDDISKGPITIKNISDDMVSAELNISVSADSYGGMIGYCGWAFSNCYPVMPGTSLAGSKLLFPGDIVDPVIDAMPYEDAFFFNVEYLLTYNEITQKINVIFSSAPVGLPVVNKEKNNFVFTQKNGLNTFEYTASHALTLEIFDLTGKKISAITLNSATNSAILPNFSKGIYVYRVVENGKTISTNKLIIR